MKIILTTLLFIVTFHCEAQNNSDSEKEDYTPEEHELLANNSKKFKKLTYDKAVKQFGEPYETKKITVASETLPLILSDDLIKKHFPKNIEHYKNSYIIEASWKMLSESWITVWYKLENDIWKPINILVTI